MALSENQKAAMAALEKTLKTDPPSNYAGLTSWKKNANGAQISVKSLVGAGVVEEAKAVIGGRVTTIYRPKS